MQVFYVVDVLLDRVWIWLSDSAENALQEMPLFLHLYVSQQNNWGYFNLQHPQSTMWNCTQIYISFRCSILCCITACALLQCWCPKRVKRMPLLHSGIQIANLNHYYNTVVYAFSMSTRRWLDLCTRVQMESIGWEWVMSWSILTKYWSWQQLLLGLPPVSFVWI